MNTEQLEKVAYHLEQFEQNMYYKEGAMEVSELHGAVEEIGQVVKIIMATVVQAEKDKPSGG